MRMIWLLVFGLIHFYFIWFGDILSLYALCGLLLFFFRNLSARALVRWGIGFVVLQFLQGLAEAARAFLHPVDRIQRVGELQQQLHPGQRAVG